MRTIILFLILSTSVYAFDNPFGANPWTGAAGEATTDYTLTLTSDPNGYIESTDGFLKCGVTFTDCIYDYASASTPELTAVPDTGYQFNNFTGDLTGATNPQNITMDSAKGVGVVFSMASTTEDFTAYTVEDPNTHIARTSTTITASDITKGEDAYVYDDKGVNHFSADFSHQFVMNFSNSVNNGLLHFWGVSNSIDDLGNVANAAISLSANGLSTPRIYLRDRSSDTSDLWLSAAYGTDYYVTVTRDDDAGTSSLGLVTAVIRTGSHTGTVQDTLSINLTAQEDFQYVYGMSSDNDNTPTSTMDGVSSNLDLGE